MAGLVEAQGDGDFILESARSGVVGVDRNHRPGGRLVENRDFPRMEKIMNRFLDDDKQSREVRDSGGIRVGKPDRAPVNMWSRG